MIWSHMEAKIQPTHLMCVCRELACGRGFYLPSSAPWVFFSSAPQNVVHGQQHYLEAYGNTGSQPIQTSPGEEGAREGADALLPSSMGQKTQSRGVAFGPSCSSKDVPGVLADMLRGASTPEELQG